MKFEDLQTLWESQEREPLYVIHTDTIHKLLQQKARKFQNLILFFEVALIGTSVGLVAMYLRLAWRKGLWHPYVSAGILLLSLSWFLRSVWARRKHQATFENSLRGDLKRAIWQLDHQIQRSRKLGWGFLLPMVLAASLDYALRFKLSLVPFWLAFLVVMGFATWAIEWEIRCWYEPRKKDLLALQKKLEAPEA